MPITPDILSSAQTLYKTGFDRLNKSSAAIVQSTLDASPPKGDATSLRPQITDAPVVEDSLIQGIADSIRATVEVSAASALVHAYNTTTDALLDILRPRDKRNP